MGCPNSNNAVKDETTIIENEKNPMRYLPFLIGAIALVLYLNRKR